LPAPWDAGTSYGIDPAIPLAGRCTVGDQSDVDAPLLCPDRCLDGPRTRGEAVSVDEDLCLGAINRIDREGRAVLLGRKADRDRRPCPQGQDGYGKRKRTNCERGVRTTRLTGYIKMQDFFVSLRDNFAALHREGEQTPKMMTVALHCRLAGKPARADAFARFVDHILRCDRVWICRRNEMAEHWRRQHPATGEKE